MVEFVDLIRVRLGAADALKPGELHEFKSLFSADDAERIPGTGGRTPSMSSKRRATSILRRPRRSGRQCTHASPLTAVST